jgi:hypothetical protein
MRLNARVLCESPGALNAADNAAYDDAGNNGYFSSVEAWDAPEFFAPINPSSNISFIASPYNPDDVGIWPIARNEADSDIEIQKQTNLFQKVTKIGASMLQFFPGTTGYMSIVGQAPAKFVIPDTREAKSPLKTGLLGTILAPPEAINVIRKDVVEEPKEPGFWSKYFDAYAQAGATSTAAGGVDFIKTKGVEQAKSVLTDTFGPPPISPETRSGIDAVLQTAAGKEQFNMNWLLLGGAALVLILLIVK